MRDPFVGLTIACAGDFGAQATETDIRRWIENNGGQYSQVVDNNVHYLIVADQAWNSGNSKVQKAQSLNKVRAKEGKPEIQIVSFDWLEDSTRTRKRLSGRKYSVAKKLKEKNAMMKRKDARRGEILEKKKDRRAIDEYKDLMTLETHRVYRDLTDFEYEVTLTRVDREDNNLKEVYKLRIWESKGFPHLYACCATFSKGPSKAGRQLLKPMGSWFWDCFRAFTEFFESKTGKKWDERLNGARPARGKFEYILPRLGWPAGMLPEGVCDHRLLENSDSDAVEKENIEPIRA